MLIALWILIGLFFVPAIFVGLGLWVSARLDNPHEYGRGEARPVRVRD